MALVALSACSETGFRPAGWDPDAEARIVVQPQEIQFAEARIGEQQLGRFSIQNQGTAVLRLERIELDPGDFSLLTDTAGMAIQPGGEREVDIAFDPSTQDAYAVAMVVSDDPDDGRIPVYLSGSTGEPDLVIQPDVYDFGGPGLGCDIELPIDLWNAGGEALQIDAIELSAHPDFQLALPELPLGLAPGATQSLLLRYQPSEIGPQTALIQVDSTDPEGVELARQLADPVEPAQIIEEFEVPEDPEVDLLFAIDHSCSMWDDAEDLGDNFDEFIDALADVTDGWTAGVVTQDDGCLDALIEPEDDNFAENFAAAVAVPTNRNEPGSIGETNEDLTEALLTVTRNALEQSTEGGCNEGFLRPGALTHVVNVSDEPDHSPEGWVSLTSEMLDLTEELRISAVAGDYPSGCDSADAGFGYYESVEATGGAFLSICADWGGNVESLAETTIDALFSFPLAEQPVVDTLVVLLDGVAQEEGWAYDEVTNSVAFDRILPAGSEVLVSYTELVPCEG